MATALQSVARGLGLGKLLYHGYHAPLGFLRRCGREGPANLLWSRLGQAQMEATAWKLPRVEGGQGRAVEVHFLTGRKFWYQTAYCAVSLGQHVEGPVVPVVYDDGSLDSEREQALRAIFPQTRVIPRAEIEARLDQVLPERTYPSLRARRLVYPHLRKLTDVHAGGSGWKLVLDSDMLFFRRPEFLLRWLASPQRPCYMLDVDNAYGYPIPLMQELTGAPIADRVNVGVCGLASDKIDWDRLEFWCRSLLERVGPHYYQEQALTAMLVAGQACDVAPREEYVALPARTEAERPAAVMHHYVAEAKAWYFRLGWRHVWARANGGAA